MAIAHGFKTYRHKISKVNNLYSAKRPSKIRDYKFDSSMLLLQMRRSHAALKFYCTQHKGM
jgi:hypothetical protein